MTRSPHPEPRRYLKLSDASWELVRAAYLSGLSAPVVAARFGITTAALRKRATRHGWTKAAYALGLAPPPEDAAPLPTPQLDLTPAVLARTALTAAARAAVEGRPGEARMHASAGIAMARLSSEFPELEWVQSVHEREWGQSQVQLAVREQALTLAKLLAEGHPLPTAYAEVEAMWARQEAAADPSPSGRGRGPRPEGVGG